MSASDSPSGAYDTLGHGGASVLLKGLLLDSHKLSPAQICDKMLSNNNHITLPPFFHSFGFLNLHKDKLEIYGRIT